ncbi:GIY-YIG nuclease family protein [Aquimarina sp. 2201CG14-23]|uniref:GIY-YIG nuclease family protein n=1 Tax=Aquimarina mycalae TaxID=3040073 RepID=UPI002477F441|nr:GIY-YIG nuclease family protein [Aquimarina sp. 2201CG14-23]MDH7447710.1 GIY-YIG nuclease family protein [Aquimarina sp. 2201CG14-23]
MTVWSVYIITNKKDGVLYIGVTKDLKRRMYQHENKVHPTTFSARYNLDKLVYFENYDTKEAAYIREKQMKKWNREWKIKLIKQNNSDWNDLNRSLKIDI